jgi:hypothetical protein
LIDFEGKMADPLDRRIVAAIERNRG